MEIHVHLHIDLPTEVVAQLGRIASIVGDIQEKVMATSQVVNDLVQAVADEKTVDDSILALVTQFAATIEQNKDDPAAIQAAVDQLRAEKTRIAAAVTANTPAAPAPDQGSTGAP